MTDAPEAMEELSQEEMTGLLMRTRYGRLGLAFENEAYVVPVSFLYDGEAVRFCIGKVGKMTTYLQANPQVCFEVDDVTDRGWCSVICYGTATLSDADDARREFLRLSGKESPSDGRPEQNQRYYCIMSIDEMTGRRSQGYVA